MHLHRNIQVLIFFMKRLIAIPFFVLIHLISYSQAIEGTSGYMNIPSAEMRTDGTFIFGANYLPNAITPSPYFDYNTENYFFNFTFLPFVEFTYRETLMKSEGVHNQDRSFGLRLRLLKETKLLPSIVAGGNDLYSTGQKLGSTFLSKSNKFFNSTYLVGTKHLLLKGTQLGLNLGFGISGVQKMNLDGFFGGISFEPSFLPTMRVMAEYDSKVFSAGVEKLFFKHLYLFGMAYHLKYLAGGLAYRIYLKT